MNFYVGWAAIGNGLRHILEAARCNPLMRENRPPAEIPPPFQKKEPGRTRLEPKKHGSTLICRFVRPWSCSEQFALENCKDEPQLQPKGLISRFEISEVGGAIYLRRRNGSFLKYTDSQNPSQGLGGDFFLAEGVIND